MLILNIIFLQYCSRISEANIVKDCLLKKHKIRRFMRKQLTEYNAPIKNLPRPINNKNFIKKLLFCVKVT